MEACTIKQITYLTQKCQLDIWLWITVAAVIHTFGEGVGRIDSLQ